MTISPLRQFVLSAALWLPLMFFLWFVLQSGVVYLPIRITALVLEGWMPEIFTSFGQEHHEIVYGYVVSLGAIEGLQGSGLGIDDQRNNVLVFCYGLPLLFGLILSTPLNWRNTFLQFGIGYTVLTAVESFGLIGTVLKTLAFGVGPAVQAALVPLGYGEVATRAGMAASSNMMAALQAHGLSPDLIALWSQFGYLVLPAVAPAALWILMNRRFLEALVGWGGEPEAADSGPTPSDTGDSNA